MTIETLEVGGFIGCLRSLRLPFKKECRSVISYGPKLQVIKTLENIIFYNDRYNIEFDKNDLLLLQTLIKRGDEHAKAIRLINVTCEINAPLFFWSEMDTYEVGVVNGCSESTMHTLKREQITQENFEGLKNLPDFYINDLNCLIENNATIEDIKSILPSGYLQKRVINFSYQTLQRIVHQRTNHRLPQWKIFIDWVHTLPFAEELIFIEK